MRVCVITVLIVLPILVLTVPALAFILQGGGVRSSMSSPSLSLLHPPSPLFSSPTPLAASPNERTGWCPCSMGEPLGGLVLERRGVRVAFL